jgi:glycosyltransferase involved in cell wall biosynthesis
MSIRILLVGDNPSLATGYGRQLLLIGKRLIELGYEVIYFDTSFPMDEYKGQIYNIKQFQDEYFKNGKHIGIQYTDVRDDIGDACICFKQTDTPFPYEDIKAIVRKTTPDCLLLLKDLNNFPEDFKIIVPSISYFPVDTEPISEDIIKKAYCFDKCVGISQYATNELKQFGFNVDFIPHSVNTDLIEKVKNNCKYTLREKYGIPSNKFIVGMIASNSESNNRKNWDGNLTAFKKFNDKYPDTFLFINTNMSGLNHNYKINSGLNGMNLHRYLDLIKLDNSNWTTIPNYKFRTYTDEEVYEMYMCFDVLLSCSKGEGCSLALLEAQSLGIPVITTDFTAMTENCIIGKTIKPYFLQYTQSGGLHAIPNIEDMIQALEYYYVSKNYAIINDDKIKEIINKCDYKKNGDKWDKLIKEVISNHKNNSS